MHRSRVAAAVLLAAGVLLLVALAVRIGVLWVIEPVNDALVVVDALLLAAGLALGARGTALLRGRPLRLAAVLAVAGALLGGLVTVLVRADVGAASDSEGVLVPLVPYGPGSPPSISWTLLWWQVAGPVLATTAAALLVTALVFAVAGVARAASRLRQTRSA